MSELHEDRWVTWEGHNLNYVAPEPFLVSLIKYRKRRDRHIAMRWEDGNLIGSRNWFDRGQRRLILDLDVPHVYVKSPNPEHGHLFFDVEMSWWRWALVLVALRLAGLLETGFVVWSLRRGENFVRRPGVPKDRPLPPPQEYGWVFPKRRRSS
jgi:hypothetical protein